MNDLLWVAVPNGLRSESEASIRVLVVPRLGPGELEEFGLGDWPAVITGEDVVFSMHTNTSAGNNQPAARNPDHVKRAKSDVWAGFFTGDARLINGYQAPTEPALVVRGTSTEAANVATTYRDITRTAAKPTNNVESAIRTAVTGWEGDESDRPPTSTPTELRTDFHATVSRLREHPRVLVELGLVFELIVDIADLNRGVPGAGRQLSIGCEFPTWLKNLVVSPWTQYELDLTLPNTGFWPAPIPASDSSVRRGMLDLSSSAPITGNKPADFTRWAIATFDVDGVVGNLRQSGRDIKANPQVPATMPPMRSVGLALLRPNRGNEVVTRVRAARDRAQVPTDDTVFGADDLVLGYRVDIRRAGDPWRPLCERWAKYEVDGILIGAGGAADGYVLEEGHVKPFAAVRDGDGVLHTDEIVLRWGGWSPTLPLPDLRGDTTGSNRRDDTVLPYNFDFKFRIPRNPGRLPQLRFATEYQLRVRIADMTGGGLMLNEAGSLETNPVIYRRHEPIQPPRIGASGDFAPGAAVDRMVIRSDDNMSAVELHAADRDYPHTEIRTLDAPSASLQLVEQHGEFDELTDEESFTLAQQAMDADADGSGLPDPATDVLNAFIGKEPGGLSEDLNEHDGWGVWPEYSQKKMQLKEHTDAEEPVTMKWLNNVLHITLGKAEQATIVLSSRIRDNYEDNLAMLDYLRSDPPVSLLDTKIGRNPVVTPPRRILVVHAIRRPLAKPRWNTPVIEQAPRDTTIVLNATFTPADAGAEGLNTDSTGQLEVDASWTEYEDIGEEAVRGKRDVTVKHLHRQSIARGDPPPMRILHEFGDTKHRTVTYCLHATSRFREYFKPSEPEEWFHLSQEQKAIPVLSTVRPPAPVVLGVVPAFQWQRTRPHENRIEHTRRARRLRVELARPWFQTGEGEQLATIVAPSSSLPAAAADVVTRIGRDPLFGTPATPSHPTPDWFPNPAQHQQVTLPEINTRVTIIPVDVTPGGDRWYADIDFTAAAVPFYNPFVQLAVVRYQPGTLERLLPISPVVIADRVPLLPDRNVVVSRTGNQITITVDGTSPTPRNRLEAILESCPANLAETLDLVVDDTADDPQIPAWRPVSGKTVERDPQSGVIPPIILTRTPGERLRVRLRETEDRVGEAEGQLPADLLRRNVFVDTIILPATWQPAM